MEEVVISITESITLLGLDIIETSQNISVDTFEQVMVLTVEVIENLTQLSINITNQPYNVTVEIIENSLGTPSGGFEGTTQQLYEILLGMGNFITVGTKKTGINGGIYKQLSLDDDYLYVCVVGGDPGVAVWKKTVLFQT
jgi:hypothetical protein